MLHPPGLTPADAGRKLASSPDEKPGDPHQLGLEGTRDLQAFGIAGPGLGKLALRWRCQAV